MAAQKDVGGFLCLDELSYVNGGSKQKTTSAGNLPYFFILGLFIFICALLPTTVHAVEGDYTTLTTSNGWSCDLPDKTNCTQYLIASSEPPSTENPTGTVTFGEPTGKTASCTHTSTLISETYTCTTRDANTGQTTTASYTEDIVGDNANTQTVNSEGTPIRNDSSSSNALADLGDAAKQLTLGLIGVVVLFITEIINWILAFVLAFVSWIFDITVTEFVIQMGKYITSDSAAGVRLAWTIVRDFANIAIIGGLVATAIGTILGNDKYNVNKTLARIIIAALLVNFSYFFAAAIIDFSNFTATQAYQHMVKNGDQGPAAAVMGSLGLSRMINAVNDYGRAGNSVGSTDTTSVLAQGTQNQLTTGSGLGSASPNRDTNVGVQIIRQATLNLMETFFIVAILFVFLSAISLLIARFIALVFVIVTSPVGIAGGSLPILKNYADEWWKALWSQALFAPAFFFLLGIALKVYREYQNVQFISPGTLDVANNEGLVTILGTIISMVIGIGFLLLALDTAKKMSAQASQFKGLYEGVQKWGTGLIGRETIGRAGYMISQYYPSIAGRMREGNVFKGDGKYTGGLTRALNKGLQGVTKIPGVGLIGRPADRAIQALGTQLGSQKFAGGKSFKDVHEEKKARKTALDDKKDELENKDEITGRFSDAKVAREKADLEKKKKERERLERIDESKRTDAQKKRLAELQAQKDNDEKRLAKINEYAQLRKEFGDDVRRNRAGEIISEGDRLNALNAKIAKGETLTGAEREELKRLTKLDALKDEFEHGGLEGKTRRSLGRRERAQALGERIENTNEVARKNQVDGKTDDMTDAEVAEMRGIESIPVDDRTQQQKDKLKDFYDKRTLSKEDESTYLDALSTDPAARNAAHAAAIAKARTHLTSWDRDTQEDLSARAAGLSARQRATLATLQAKQRAGKLTDDDAVTLLQLKRLGGGLKETGAAESEADWRGRQLERGELGRGFTQEADGTWKVEDASSYEDRLDANSTIGLRKARGEADLVLTKLPPNFWKEEYDKDPKRLLRYSSMLSTDKFIELTNNHEFSEGIRNEMWRRRRGDWIKRVVRLNDKLKSGEWTKDNPEYQKERLDLFNWSSRNVQSKEILALVQSSAAFVHRPDGSEVRGKDLLREGMRDTFLNTTSSTAYAELKASGILPTNAAREAAKAKRDDPDEIRDEEAAYNVNAGLEGSTNWTPNEAGTVQYYAEPRRRKAMERLLSRSESQIKRYESGQGGVSDAAYIKAVKSRRKARILLGQAGAFSFKPAIETEISFDANGIKQGGIIPEFRGKSRQEIRRIVVEQTLPPDATPEEFRAAEAKFSDKEMDTFLKARLQTELESEYTHEQNDPSYRSTALDTYDNADGDIRFIIEQRFNNRRSAAEYFKGKNVDEVKAILNKRSWWSTATARGMTLTQLNAVVGQDIGEIARLSENILMFGNDSLIYQCMNNPQLKDVFIAPSKERQFEINSVRLSQGRPPLRFDKFEAGGDE